ncbi:MAG: hypothetical protein S4CHLAM81_11110 [Chlamydiales bacterium]|nr:hypothetical protein [Chlamydiales bacterium]MCH9635889.1 hypothetical protein [Chlamydiales bacterium]MCH9703335.1 hypothetical protein [Chlamydiota bacterium]
MANDVCVDACTAVACACCAEACIRSVGGVASADRTTGIALGILIGLATIGTCLALAYTNSTVYNRWTGGYYVVSNMRYLPAAAVIGGLFTLTAFAGAASARR